MKPFSIFGMATKRVLDRRRVGTVKSKLPKFVRIPMVSMDSKLPRDTRLRRQIGHHHRIVDQILRHVPTGRPLASRNGHQSCLRNRNRMIPTQLRSIGIIRGFDERPYP